MGLEESRSATDARQVRATWKMSIAVHLLPVAAWMGLIFTLSSRRQLPDPLGPNLTAVAGHLVAYAVLAALLWFALAPWRLAPGRRLTLAFAITVIFGVSDEWHQAFVPGRTPALIDVATDALGAIGGLMVLGLRARTRARVETDGGDASCTSYRHTPNKKPPV